MTKALKQLIHQQVYVDMKNREIHVGGQLVYYEGGEGYCFHNSETKTDADIRDIPMTQMVYDAFRKQRELKMSTIILQRSLTWRMKRCLK